MHPILSCPAQSPPANDTPVHGRLARQGLSISTTRRRLRAVFRSFAGRTRWSKCRPFATQRLFDFCLGCKGRRRLTKSPLFGRSDRQWMSGAMLRRRHKVVIHIFASRTRFKRASTPGCNSGWGPYLMSRSWVGDSWPICRPSGR